MEKCWCEQARLEIDNAWDHPIRTEDGEGGSGCKRLREIMDAEIEYAKACEYCPCRKRVRLEDNVFAVDGKAEICTADSALEASESNSSQCQTTETISDTDGAIGVEGPCQCTVAIARMAALLEQDYGTDQPTIVEQSLLPSDDELDEIHQDYSKSRALCTRCGVGETTDPERCSCRRACNRRSDYELLAGFDESSEMLAEYRAHYAEAEMQWVYETNRCLACKERMKDCSVIYRVISIPGHIWKIKRRVLKAL